MIQSPNLWIFFQKVKTIIKVKNLTYVLQSCVQMNLLITYVWAIMQQHSDLKINDYNIIWHQMH